MKIKNTAKGGRGLGVGGSTIEWAPGEVKDVEASVIAEAMKDPANAELLGADLVEVVEGRLPPALTNPSGSPEDIAKIEAAAQKAREDADAQAKADEAARVAETEKLAEVVARVETPAETPPADTKKGPKK